MYKEGIINDTFRLEKTFIIAVEVRKKEMNRNKDPVSCSHHFAKLPRNLTSPFPLVTG